MKKPFLMFSTSRRQWCFKCAYIDMGLVVVISGVDDVDKHQILRRVSCTSRYPHCGQLWGKIWTTTHSHVYETPSYRLILRHTEKLSPGPKKIYPLKTHLSTVSTGVCG